MINLSQFIQSMQKNRINFFTGVPDSLLKDFSAYVMDNISADNHIIAANEGNAIGLAAGVQLATAEIPCVYLQNSGLGNLVNPIVSLTSPEVYSIPMLLMIGWRGEPGVKDEPQHLFQGEITEDLLKSMRIPYQVIDDNHEASVKKLEEMVEVAREKFCPVALLVKKNSFESYTLKDDDQIQTFSMEREEAIQALLELIDEKDIVLSTTGKISRELFESRVMRNESTSDFYNVGSMGHVSQIAYGVSLKTNKQVFCFDGDGAFLMHMGGAAIIGGDLPAKNFVHIVLNNCAHDSVGGQPTIANKISLASIAQSCGYENTFTIESLSELTAFFSDRSLNQGPTFVEIKVKKGARKNLGRPTKTPLENKNSFINKLRD